MSVTKKTRSSKRIFAMMLTLVVVLGLMAALYTGVSAAQSFYTETDHTPSTPVVLVNGNFGQLDPDNLPAGSACETADSVLGGAEGLKVTDDPAEMNQIGWVYVPESEVTGWSIKPSSETDNDQPLAHYIEIQLWEGDARVDLFGAMNQELYQVVDTIPGQTIYYSFQVTAPANPEGNFRFRLGPSDGFGSTVQVEDIVNEPVRTHTYADSYVAEDYKTYFGFASTGVTANTGRVKLNDGNWISETTSGNAVKVSQAGPHLDNIVFQTSSKLIAEKSLLRGGHEGYEVSNAYAGEILRYRIHISNLGQTEAGNIIITDELPDNLAYVGNATRYGYQYDDEESSLEGNATYDDNAHTVTFSNMAQIRGTGADGLVNEAYGDYYVEFDVQVKDDAADSMIKNQVSIDYKDAGYEGVNGSSHTSYSNILETPVLGGVPGEGYYVYYHANAPVSGTAPIDYQQYGLNATPQVLTDSSMSYYGFSFAGWALSSDGDAAYQPGDTLAAMTGDVDLYAIWTPAGQYHVTYDRGAMEGYTIDGIDPQDARSYYANEIAEIMDHSYTVSTAEDGSTCVFTGWKLGDKSYAPGSSFEVTGDATLTAQWLKVLPNEYPLIYHENGATQGKVPDTDKYLAGAEVSVSVVEGENELKRDGYSFLGWSRSASGTRPDYVKDDQFLMPDQQLDLYAVWQADDAEFHVIYDVNGGGGTAPEDGTAYLLGDPVAVMSQTTSMVADSDGIFVGWNTAANGSGSAYDAAESFNIKDDTTLYAQWLSGSKTAADATPADGLLPGDELIYYINVNLPTDADSLLITDPVPANTTYVAGSAASSGGSLIGNTVTWSLGKTSAGVHRFSFKVTVNEGVAATAEIVNTAGGSFNNKYGFSYGNTTTLGDHWTVTYNGNDDSAVNVPVDDNAYANNGEVSVMESGRMKAGDKHFICWNTKADGTGTSYMAEDTFNITADTELFAQWLSSVKSVQVPDVLTPSEPLVYTITVTVPQACESFSIEDKIPTGTSFVTGSATSSVGGVESVAGIKTANNVVKWNFGAMAANTTITATFAVEVDDDVPNTGIENVADVIIGDNTYKTNIVIVSTGDGWKVKYDGNGNTSGTAPVDTSVYPNGGTVTVAGNIDLAKDDYEFAGWNTAPDGSGSHYDGSDEFSIDKDTTLYAQWVKSEKTSVDVTASNGLMPGDMLIYTIAIELPADAQTVTVTDSVPANTTFVSASNEGAESNGTVSWTKSAAEWKALGGKVTFSVTVDGGTPAGTDIQNEASLELGNNGPIGTLTYTTNKTHDLVEPKSVKANDGYRPGSVLEYTIMYVNDTAENADIVITDVVPAGASYINSSATGPLTGHDTDSNTLTWEISNAAPGQSGQVSFKVKVNDNVSSSIINQASTQVGDNDPKLTNTVRGTNDIKLSTVKDKETGAVKDQPMPGDIITYTVNFANDSDGPASVTITDTIPRFTHYVEGSAGLDSSWDANDWEISVKDGVVTWYNGYVGSRDSGFVTFDVMIDEDAAAGSMVKNTARVNNVLTNQTVDIVEPKIVSEAEADIIYTDPDTTTSDNVYRPGEELTYTIYYTNDTNDLTLLGEKPTVVITDTVPNGTRFVSADPDDNGAVTADASGKLTWTFNDVRQGSVNQVSFKVIVDTNEALVIKNTATVTVGEREPKITNETHGGVEAKNSKDITPEDGLLPGDTLSYSVDYVNFADTAATLSISDSLPAHTSYVTGSAKLNGTPVPVSVVGGKLSLTLENVASGKGGRLTFEVTVDEDALSFDPLSNTATVAIGDNTQTTNTTVDIVNGKDSDDADEIYTPGQEITYKIVYANEALEAANIVVTDVIPEFTQFVAGSATVNGTAVSIAPDANGVLTWSIANVVAGDSGYVSFKVTVLTNAMESIENQATVGDRDPHVTQQVIGTVQPKLSQDGTPGDGLRPGDTLHYEIGYANNTAAAANVTVTDSIPEYTTFVAGSAKINDDAIGLGVVNGQLTFVVNGVAAQSGGSVSFDVTVNEDAMAFDEIRNIAQVKVGGNNPTTTNETIDIVDPKQTNDSGEMAASIYQPGQELTYSIKYANNTTIPQNITITDVIPTNTSYVAGSVSHNGTVSGNTISWRFADVAAGTVGTVSFKVVINSNASVVISNQAFIKIGDRKPFTINTNNETGTVEAKSSAIEKPAAGLMPGDSITYTVAFMNTASSAANIKVTDIIPSETSFKAGSATVNDQSVDITPDGSGKLTFTIENVAAQKVGKVSFQVTVNDNTAAGTAIKNKAEVQVGSNAPVVTNETVDIVEAKTSNTAGGKYQVGDEITYTVNFANDYFQQSTVTVSDVIPSGTEYVAGSGSVSVDGGAAQGIAAPVGGKLTYSAQLAPGAVGQLTFTVKTVSGGTLNNTATVEVGGHDPHFTNTVTDRADVKSSEIKADQAEDGLQTGDTLIYTVNYANEKNAPQTIVITDAIPDKTTFVAGSAKLNGVTNTSLRPANGKLTWTIEDVAAGASGSVSFEVKVNASAATGTVITNTASIKIGSDAPSITNKTVDIVNAKTVNDTDGVYYPGQILTYTVKYGNSTTNSATVTVTDIIPAGTEFVSGSAKVNGIADTNLVPSNGQLTWVLNDVAPGSSGNVSFQVTVASITAGTQIDNQAFINNRPTNTVSGKVTTKTSNAPGSGVTPGAQITYNVTYRNSTAAEQLVKITDAVPANTTYVNNSANYGGSLKNELVTWEDLRLAAGQSVTVSFKVTVNAGTANGTEIRNQATLIPPVGSPVVTNETVDVVKSTPGGDPIEIENPKSVDDKGALSNGKKLTYTIRFANNKPTAQDIVITDRIPAGTEFVAGSAKMSVDGESINVRTLKPNSSGKLIWNADDVDPGTSGSVSFTVKVTATSGSVSNTGSIKIGNDPAFDTNTVTNRFPGGNELYTLTFVTNGGSSVAPITREKGSVIRLDQITTRNDYTFEGWYLDKELTKRAYSVTLNSDMSVYAKWTKNVIGQIDWDRTNHFAYVIGYPDGKVHPQGNITRGETATIFFRLMTEASRNAYWKTSNSFSDVNRNTWFNTAVSTMSNAGFISGYPDGSFGGNKPITRAEFAVIAARANGSDGQHYGNKFTDLANSWAKGYINDAVDMGLIAGYPDGSFKPNAYITRAEAMTIVNRFLGRDKVDASSLIRGMITWPDNMSTSAWYYYAVQEATNSHEFTRQYNNYETWTKITPVRDWAALELGWSSTNSGR